MDSHDTVAEAHALAAAGGGPPTVSIRPGAAVLSVLKHLNYRPWYALAEFVDNAVQSFTANRVRLEGHACGRTSLRVDIEIDGAAPARMAIRDNAAGIALREFGRAFRPAAVPIDRAGLSEFGMGMKSAACWFAPNWRVRTQALGDDVIRTVRFNVEQIVREELEELEVAEEPGRPGDHFTEVVLEQPYHVPQGRTVGKIKEHLTDIYRCFTRRGDVTLSFNGEVLRYSDPEVLVAPYDRGDPNVPLTWRKEIDFDFGCGLSVRGFAGLMQRGSFARSGFALFRRGRLIVGSGDEGYKPPSIFLTSSGNYRHLRLFGELHLEGFEVSHTKDGFRWDENEEPFLEILKEVLDADELPLLRQVDHYRTLAPHDERLGAANKALDRVTESLAIALPKVMERVSDTPGLETDPMPLPPSPLLAERSLGFDFRGERWTVRIELTDSAAESEWLAVSSQPGPGATEQILQIRVSMAHPFMISFGQTDPDDIEALVRVAAAVMLGEILATRGGVRLAGTVRRNMNDILREALARRPAE